MTALYKIVAFLPQDTIDHLDRIAAALAARKEAPPTRSEAVKYLVRQHWKKQVIRSLDTRKKIA